MWAFRADGDAARMVRYRRNRAVDGMYFFTVTLRDRRSDLLVRHVDALRDAWRQARTRVSHEVVALVVLPDHLHAVIAMHDGADDYSRLWQDLKKGFTRRLGARPGAVWQARFWEHTIRSDDDLRRCVDYVHINPVKHGLAIHVRDWPYSSFHRFARDGGVPLNWAGENP